MSEDATTLASRLYGLALLAFPFPLRQRYGVEMRQAFRDAYRRRRDLGGASARRFALRAILDALKAGFRTRFGPGGVTRTSSRSPLGRHARRSTAMLVDEIRTDLNQSFRGLADSPVFTVTVLVVLALGIGINGAIFTAIEATILADPPYPDADRLVLVDLGVEGAGEAGLPRAFPWSVPKYEILAATEELGIDPVAAYATRDLTLSGRGDPVELQAEVVTADYFRVVGIPPAIGRDFAAGSGEPERQVVLGHALWRERLGADPDVVGRRIVLNGEPMVAIGVAAAGFRGLSGEADLWVPVASTPVLLSPRLLTNAQGHWLQGIGRLAPGVTLQQARARLDGVAARVNEAYPWLDPDERIGGSVRRLSDARRNPAAQRAVLVVGGAAGLVLLIACANLAGLMLARSLERRRETAVRLALGAPRSRIVRAVLTESVLLGLAGGALGLVLAAWGIDALAAAWPQDFLDGGWNLRFVDPSGFGLDPTVALYTIGLALLAGVLFGVAPALRLSRADLGLALQEGARGSRSNGRGSGGYGFGGRRLLVAAEVALAMVLLVGAGLMISSLGQLLAVDPGFDPDRLLTFEYALSPSSPAAEEPLAFHEAFLERVRALPGVEAATMGCPPMWMHCWIGGVKRAGERTWQEGDMPGIGIQIVGTAFRATLGIELLAGRWLAPGDDLDSSPVVVLSETAARRLYPGQSPLGRPFAATIGLTPDEETAEVVGVVEDVVFGSPEEGVMSEAYVSQRQMLPGRSAHVIVRTTREPLAIVPDVRAALAELDPGLAVAGVTTVGDLAADHVSDTRAVMTLLATFAGIALLLAAVGVWGIVAYSVSRRRRELGIRMALGAGAGKVVRMVLGQGLWSAAVGVAVGLGAGLLSARLLSSLLYGVSARDPRVFVAGAGLLVVVASLAAWLPARRVARVNPVEAVRAE